jgi:hypothetical protein
MKRGPVVLLALCSGVLGLLLSGCATSPFVLKTRAELQVPALDNPVTVDGELDEPCYRRAPLVTSFVIAGNPGRRPAATSAWMFWDRDRLIFAFDCEDPTLVASPPTANERDVDPQDRVELFLWSGRKADSYYCIEIAARGAVHDYTARFYRRFDDTWSPRGWQCAVKPRPGGYRVEAALSRAALEEMGLRLRAEARWRIGLFRADYTPDRPDAPDWITWVDARTLQPDFHVAGAFGDLVLQPQQQ